MTHALVFNRQPYKTLFALAASLVIAGCSTEDDLTAGADSTGQLQTALLSWVAPAEREDNTPLSLAEIAGYRLYYGLTTGDYQYDIEVSDASSTEINVSLPAATFVYSFATLVGALWILLGLVCKYGGMRRGRDPRVR